jgi:hypothetical protein
LDFVEDFPQIVPDSPLAHVQFSVKWKCVNTGDEDSPEAVFGSILSEQTAVCCSSIGRNVASLRPGETDEDTVGVGAVGSGSLTVTINGVSAEISITVS